MAFVTELTLDDEICVGPAVIRLHPRSGRYLRRAFIQIEAPKDTIIVKESKKQRFNGNGTDTPGDEAKE